MKIKWSYTFSTKRVAGQAILRLTGAPIRDDGTPYCWEDGKPGAKEHQPVSCDHEVMVDADPKIPLDNFLKQTIQNKDMKKAVEKKIDRTLTALGLLVDPAGTEIVTPKEIEL